MVRERVPPPVHVRAEVARGAHEGDTQPTAHQRAERLPRAAGGGDGEQRERVLGARAGGEEKTTNPLRERAALRGGAETNRVRTREIARESLEREARLLW